MLTEIKCAHCNYVVGSDVVNREQAISEMTEKLTKHLQRQHPKETIRWQNDFKMVSQLCPWLILFNKHSDLLERINEDLEKQEQENREEFTPSLKFLVEGLEIQTDLIQEHLGIPNEEDDEDEEGEPIQVKTEKEVEPSNETTV